MSSADHIALSDDDDDDVVFRDFRNINNRFQQRLLEAQHAATEKQIEDQLDLMEKDLGPQDIQRECHTIQSKIDKVEAEVDALKQQLSNWQAKRKEQASLTNMTPEERANKIEQQRQRHESIVIDQADLDSIFDYLSEIGQSYSNAAGLKPHRAARTNNNEMTMQALQSPDVLEQVDFTHIEFTTVENKFYEDQSIEDVTDSGNLVDRSYRDCTLEGKSYNSSFKVTFRIDALLDVNRLDFDLDMDLHVDAGPILLRRMQFVDVISLDISSFSTGL
ncbi:uncharacterized protein BX664DRAFT_124424 [Halteromyces radiatus]|uniref:uncharacterized protein n=1 Tax=Halteromyces radiatus TaxID=101107 RepID=UPI00221E8F52|nr:uncharacterized protein BX664DRAFT_124424 [Halteromyces radiatus]KAI8088957.1 hypothetical protein BX664DRAFT_124424 [Halteromyces radiatus]